MIDPIEARFLAKVAPPNENGCTLWTAGLDKKGYGRIRINGRAALAHRYAAGMLDFPPELQTRHLCPGEPNRSCVNPEHLGYGTNADNHRDMMEAGRHVAVRGSKQGRAKLTEEQVLEIRRKYEAGGATLHSLAAEFGVGKSAVSYIVRRETWKHI